MKYNNKTARYKYYTKKKMGIFLRGLTLQRIKGRLTGPKVILNSLPKSGTHLIETLFFNLPVMRHYGGRTIMINNHDNSYASGIKIIKGLKEGQFAPAHIQYDDPVYELIKTENVKLVQIIRDPRDVLISHLLYVKDLDTTHKESNYIKSFDDEIDQFIAVIDGEKNIIEPFKVVADKFSEWTDKKDVLTVKFEDLVGSNGGGSDEAQLNAVKRIVNHVGINIPDIKLQYITRQIFSSKSSTFNTGRINKWKTVFTSEHKEVCKAKIQSVLEFFGYEKDASW